MATLETIPYRFGGFILEPDRRALRLGGERVALSARGFDILMYLLERRDRVVTKDELLTHVWRGMAVEENNLAVQISALRRALGQGAGGDPGEARIIVTVPGQGYRFVAPVDAPDDAVIAPHVAAPVAERPPAQAQPPARRRLLAWPMAAAAIWLGLAWGGADLLRGRAPMAPRLSIVVLPFRNLGSDRQQDYLADAIGDDLTTDLSHIPGSTVIARESADTYKGRAVGAEVIGRALGVRYLLEGSLHDEDGTLHINAQLIDAANAAHLWASAFDVDRGKLGQARAAIVRQIASALNVTLVQVESVRALAERPDSQDAMDFYYRARSVLDRSTTLASLIEAQGLLEKAVAAAPDFSEGLAELGSVLLQKISNFDDATYQQDYLLAKRVIERSVAIAPRGPAALAALGMLAFTDGRCREAEPNFRTALSFDPSNVSAWRGLDKCARVLGHMEDMIADLQEVLRIDPVGPRHAAQQHIIGMGFLMLGKPAEALTWFNLAGAGLTNSAGGSGAPLGWQEWRQIYMIAATQLIGDENGAARMYRDYSHVRPNRTVWQLSSYDSHALCALKGHATYLAALRAAGMPETADEHADYGIPPTSVAGEQGDLDPTPLSVPGATTIDTGKFHALLQQKAAPLIVDYGQGAAVIPGALWAWQHGLQDNTDDVIGTAEGRDPAARAKPIVVMSDGSVGWRSYKAALHLVSRGYHNVMWYRGGEAAWAASGYPAEDRRSP